MSPKSRVFDFRSSQTESEYTAPVNVSFEIHDAEKERTLRRLAALPRDRPPRAFCDDRLL
jgi:hypothetical protein